MSTRSVAVTWKDYSRLSEQQFTSCFEAAFHKGPFLQANRLFLNI